MLFLRRPQTIAIIGNGFDLAHGYDTDYRSFVDRTESPALDRFKACCDAEKIETWYAFEENIRLITGKLFLASMAEDCRYEANRSEVLALAQVFAEIHDLLQRYLAGEIAGKPLAKKPSIEAYGGKRTVALNFNYTNTAEAYFDRVLYVHGSLAERDILLGYDYREEPCLAEFSDIRWSKSICRERLAFRRFFLGRRRLSPDGRKYRALLSGLEGYQHWESSGRGLPEEAHKFIPQYRAIRRFLRRYRANPFPALDYGAVRTVVVLGHGIEADRVYLKHLLDRCGGLRQIVIFRYDGETEESYRDKRAFFAPYCGRIEQAYY